MIGSPLRLSPPPSKSRKPLKKATTLANVVSPFFHKPEWYVRELLEDTNIRDQYSTPEEMTALSLFHLDTKLTSNLDRIQQTVVTSSPPGYGPIIACCMEWGADVINKNPYVVELCELSKGFALIPSKTDGEVVATITQFFAEFDTPIDLDRTKRRKQIKVPKFLWESAGLSAIHKLTGIDTSKLIGLALIITLIEQPNMIEDHIAGFIKVRDTFFHRVEIKANLAGAMLEKYGIHPSQLKK